MTLFRLSISDSRRAASRFVTRTRRTLQKVLAEEQEAQGITQSSIARAIGVHRSVINREIRGEKDLTLGRLAELAWALGREAKIELIRPATPKGSNAAPVVAGALQVFSSSSNSAATATIERNSSTAKAA